MMNMDKLARLLALCKCGVYLTVNEHRDYYDTPAQRLEELESRECPPKISDEVRAGILSSGNIVELQFYPDTPVGFYCIVHYDLDAALDAALATFDLNIEADEDGRDDLTVSAPPNKPPRS